MNKVDVGELFGNELSGIHVAKGGGDNGIETFAGQVADHPFGIRTFGHTLQISGMHGIAQLGFDIFAPFIVRIGPATITDGANKDERDIKLVRYHFRNLDPAVRGWFIRRFCVRVSRIGPRRFLIAASGRRFLSRGLSGAIGSWCSSGGRSTGI